MQLDGGFLKFPSVQESLMPKPRQDKRAAPSLERGDKREVMTVVYLLGNCWCFKKPWHEKGPLLYPPGLCAPAYCNSVGVQGGKTGRRGLWGIQNPVVPETTFVFICSKATFIVLMALKSCLDLREQNERPNPDGATKPGHPVCFSGGYQNK